MSIRRRRFDVERINIIKYNTIEREKEISLYSMLDFTDKNASDFVNDHTDFVILFIITFLSKNFITTHECNKLIDIVECYYSAYEQGLITSKQLCFKLNHEIIQDALYQKGWNKIGMRGD